MLHWFCASSRSCAIGTMSGSVLGVHFTPFHPQRCGFSLALFFWFALPRVCRRRLSLSALRGPAQSEPRRFSLSTWASHLGTLSASLVFSYLLLSPATVLFHSASSQLRHYRFSCRSLLYVRYGLKPQCLSSHHILPSFSYYFLHFSFPTT